MELQKGKLEILNEGTQIPIDVVDANSDSLFNEGDYFQFVGGPAKPITPYTFYNIYNLQNIYWFSYQADSTSLRYSDKNGFPDNWINSYQGSPFTYHYEKDSLKDGEKKAQDSQSQKKPADDEHSYMFQSR